MDKEENNIEVVKQPNLQVRIKVMSTGVFGEYAFRGEDKAELEENGETASKALEEHLEKWKK